MINYDKISKIMSWDIPDDMTAQEYFEWLSLKIEHVPNHRIVDVVEAGGLMHWAIEHSHASTKQMLLDELVGIMRIAINERVFTNKETQKTFLPLYNFHIYCNRLDQSGKMMEEAEKISERCWYGDMQRKKLKERTDKLFENEPDPAKFEQARTRIKEIWGFTDYEMEAFRYFVAQSRHPNLNPSMNKSLFIFSKHKQTGKTSVARAIVAILNGETDLMDASKYESNLSREMQFGAHDLPIATQSNAVLLDDSLFHDTKRSYGRIKQMLTSSYCDYNPKFLRAIKIPTKRYYIFTSNDDLANFVQDDKERRFISIGLHNKPKQISFKKIYDIWKDFCTNVTPEPDFQEWYNRFELEDGLERMDVDYFKDELLSNDAILTQMRNYASYNITQKFFEDILIKGKPTRDERSSLKQALTEIIGETDKNGKGYRWSRKQAVERLEQRIEQMKLDVIVEAHENGLDVSQQELDGLPF